MSPPTRLAALLQITDIPSAGRGVIATSRIPADTIIHTSGAPALSLLFREYRKEVCAGCFFYDRGRSLPVRDAGDGCGGGGGGTGKVFCSEACRSGWVREQGPVGVGAWRRLEEFIRPKAKNDPIPLDAMVRPGVGEIEEAWERVEREVEGRKGRRRGGKTWARVDPDVLSFLLEGVLFLHRSPERWGEILDLAVDERPYRSGIELEAFCVGYQQLLALFASSELEVSVAADVCRRVVGAAGHNAFGIRSEDNEEYMGYGVYPSASYFNHSCAPNISKKRIGRQWEFRALRDIDVGEECCITYMGGDEKVMSIKDRRARSEETWGFTCTCQRCIDEIES